MARARNIKPSFFINDVLAQCEYGARLCFIGLWCLADRDGRLEDRPLRIKGQLFPYESANVDEWLTVLSDRGFITRYSVGACKYIQINAFAKHQNPHCKEPASTIPAPCANGADTMLAGRIPDSGFLIPDSGFLIPDSLPTASAGYSPRLISRDGESAEESGPATGVSYPPDFLRFWEAYPNRRKRSKGDALKAWKQAVKVAAASVIIDAATEYSQSILGSGEFSQMPATWLRARAWEDDRQAWNRKDDRNGNSNSRSNQPIIRGVREGDAIADSL